MRLPADNRMFIGRERELRELSAGLDAARAGAGALYLVGGEAGIGKTRLAEQLAARAAAAGIRVLWGRCWEMEGRPPYWPWVQIIRDLVHGCTPDALAATLGPRLPHLVQIVPELGVVAAPGGLAAAPESEAARFHLFDATATFLAQTAAITPLLLVFDDVHWADVPSLRLLEFLAHTLADKRMLVLATYRHVESRREPVAVEILGTLARIGCNLGLVGFSEPEVSLFIEHTAGHSAPEALVRAIHRQTEGNPFFVDEIVRNLRAVASGSEWVAPAEGSVPIPQGVRGAIRARVAPLGPQGRRVLAAAAVIGRDFELELLASVCGLDAPALMELLTPALERELIARVHGTPGRYRFSHVLVRDALYEELPDVERTALHRRLGETVEGRAGEYLEPHLAVLAHHFFEAAAGGDSAKAIEYAIRAGRQAMGMLAYEEAAEQFGRSLKLLGTMPDPGVRRRCEVLIALGEAQNRAGRAEAATQALREAASLAKQVGAAELLAHAAIGLCANTGLFWTEFGRSDDALVRILTEALSALRPEALALRARVMTRLATELCWTADVERAASLSQESIALARRAGDPATLAYTLLGRILCISGPDHIEERLAIVAEVLARTESTGDREIAVNALMWRIGDALQLGDLDAVRAARARLIQRVTELRQPADLWMLAAIESQTALMEGRFAAAEALVSEIVAEPTRHANAAQMASALLFLVRREQGRLAELETTLRDLVAQYPAVAVWRASLAFLYAEIGRPADAVVECDALMGAGFARLPRDVAWLYTVACLAEACAQGGSRADAEALHAALEPYANRNVVAGPIYYLGPMSYYLGQLAARLGSWNRAIRHYDEALTRCSAFGANPFVSRVLVAAARARLARGDAGDREAAANLLARAFAIAEPLGMHAIIGSVRQLQRALSGDPPGVRAGAPEQRRSTVFRREGDFWTVRRGGQMCHLRDTRGFRYLARLFGDPGREFHVLDLLRTVEDERAATPGPSGVRRSRRTGAAGEPRHAAADALLDARAKRALRDRVADLRAEVDQAEHCNDFHRAATARTEIDAISEQLASAVGLHGRDRRARTASENARVTVTKAVRNAIELIRENDPPLGRVLALTVRTGTYCSYQPTDELRVEWEL
jgi:tetratricopeptide (TPR) repeat protein